MAGCMQGIAAPHMWRRGGTGSCPDRPVSPVLLRTASSHALLRYVALAGVRFHPCSDGAAGSDEAQHATTQFHAFVTYDATVAGIGCKLVVAISICFGGR